MRPRRRSVQQNAYSFRAPKDEADALTVLLPDPKKKPAAGERRAHSRAARDGARMRARLVFQRTDGADAALDWRVITRSRSSGPPICRAVIGARQRPHVESAAEVGPSALARGAFAFVSSRGASRGCPSMRARAALRPRWDGSGARRSRTRVEREVAHLRLCSRAPTMAKVLQRGEARRGRGDEHAVHLDVAKSSGPGAEAAG